MLVRWIVRGKAYIHKEFDKEYSWKAVFERSRMMGRYSIKLGKLVMMT
jgi:hypothetical protein